MRQRTLPGRLRRRRIPRPAPPPVHGRVTVPATRWGWVIGLALILLPVATGGYLIRSDQPQRQEPASVGFVPPLPAKPHRGFALSMLVEVASCAGPARVVVVAAGTAEYWHDRGHRLHEIEHSRSYLPRRFRFALPDVRAGTLRVWRGRNATDVQVPQEPAQSAAPRRFLEIQTKSPSADRSLTVVTGTVPKWTQDLAPIVAGYEARGWLKRKGWGSCFLKLPALTGDLSVVSAQMSRGRAGQQFGPVQDFPVSSTRTKASAVYKAWLDPTHGATTVLARGGDISTGESLPSPTSSTNGSPTWACGPRTKKPGLLLGRQPSTVPDIIFGYGADATPGALARRAVELGDKGDCSALAVLIESSAGWRRDALLLLVGALVSLGFAICIELWIARFGLKNL